jgi:hypothetical protein
MPKDEAGTTKTVRLVHIPNGDPTGERGRGESIGIHPSEHLKPDASAQRFLGHGLKKRGRPSKASVELFEAAWAKRDEGGSWGDVAKILYATKRPTDRQKKDAPQRMKHYRKNHPPIVRYRIKTP